MGRIHRLAFTLGLWLVLAWPGAALAVRFQVAISSTPLDDAVFVTCNSLEACLKYVASASLTQQVSVIVSDAASANALDDAVLNSWYGMGLNVVFSYLGPFDSAAGVRAFGRLLDRADFIEQGITRGYHEFGWVANARPLPRTMTMDPTARTRMLGPPGGFASSAGLSGWGAMPNEDAEQRRLRHIFREHLAGPVFGPLQPVVPMPLPGIGDGLYPIMRLVLEFAFDFPFVPVASHTQYRVSARAFGFRQWIASIVIGLLDVHDQANRAGLVAAPPAPAIGIWEAGVIAAEALGFGGAMAPVVPGAGSAAPVGPPLPGALPNIPAFAPLTQPAWWWPKKYHKGCGPGGGCAMHQRQPPQDPPPPGGIGM